MVYYIVPAREGSKGFRHKNRKLIGHTIDNLTDKAKRRIIITTDDQKIIEEYEDYKILRRPDELATDTASMKAVLLDLADRMHFDDRDDFVLCYPTYPERTYAEVREALKWYRERNAKSLLCAKPVKSHPYLCMYDLGEGRAKQVVEHKKYRRQDYPEVFELSHYIGIFNVGELENLNPNLYNENTIYFRINKDPIDVDTKADWQKFKDRE